MSRPSISPRALTPSAVASAETPAPRGRPSVAGSVGANVATLRFAWVAAAPAADPVDDRPVILLVEDEAGVRELAVRVLRGAGFAVIAAADGPEALRTAKGRERIDALVTDVIMPGLNGRKVAESLRGRWPGLPVLFISGFTGDILGERGVLEPDVQLLTKPFGAASLVKRVREILAVTDEVA